MIAYFLQQMFIYSVLFTPIYIVLRLMYLRGRSKKWWRELIMLAFVIFCISIFSQTIVPKFSWIDGRFVIEQHAGSSNYMLFETIRLYARQLNGPIAHIAFYNLAGNILLFVPFGVLLPMLWRTCRSLFAMLAIAIGIPLFIEGTQHFIGRSVDVDDVLLNAIGILCGYFIWCFVYFFKLQVKKVVTRASSLLK